MKRTLIVVLALLLVGCASAPKYREPVTDIDPPESWSVPEADPAAPEGRWWAEFDDPALDELIEIALEGNRDLHAAAARVDRAAAEARIAGADLKPQVGVGFNATRQHQNPAALGFPLPDPEAEGGFTFSRLGLSFDVSWEIDLWGRLRAGARAALAEVQATEAELRGAELSIAGLTAKSWFAIVDAQEQVQLARDSMQSFQDVADEVRSRYERGLRPAVELRLALSNLAASRALLEGRLEQLDRLTRQLEVLLGRYPSGTLLAEFPAEELRPLPDRVPAGIPAEIVSRRPDLAAAERRLAAADQRLVQARRSLYPQLSLTASGGRLSADFDDLLDGDFSVWSIAGNLLQPIFQGGRLRANVDRTDALGREALERYAGALLNAYSEVESALAAEQRLIEREGHLAETSRQLAAALRLSEERYRLGVGDYLTVLTSQSNLLNAESSLIDVRRSLLVNRVDLHLALGGGFEFDFDEEKWNGPADSDDRLSQGNQEEQSKKDRAL
jgi:NodT family efflux transporter outer membrane factor (OMF) lipoprotein